MAYIYQTDARTLIWQLAKMPKHTYALQSVPENTDPTTKGRINGTARGASKTEQQQTHEMMSYAFSTCECEQLNSSLSPIACIHQTDAPNLNWELASVRKHTYLLQSIHKNTDPATKGRINATASCASGTDT